jgi:hypothetical protein
MCFVGESRVLIPDPTGSRFGSTILILKNHETKTNTGTQIQRVSYWIDNFFDERTLSLERAAMVSATCSWRRFSSRNFSRNTSIRVSACCAVNLVAWVFTVTLKPSTPNVFLTVEDITPSLQWCPTQHTYSTVPQCESLDDNEHWNVIY